MEDSIAYYVCARVRKRCAMGPYATTMPIGRTRRIVAAAARKKVNLNRAGDKDTPLRRNSGFGYDQPEHKVDEEARECRR